MVKNGEKIVTKYKTINLIDDSKIISSDEELCDTFNKFFANVVPNLNIPKLKSFSKARDNLDPIMSVIKSFDKHRVEPKLKLKSLIQPFISEKLAVMKLKRLSVSIKYVKVYDQVYEKINL